MKKNNEKVRITSMKQLTALIKSEIKKQYRSVRQFSIAIGVPQSTIVTSLQKGISGTAFETVLLMCKVLDIKPVQGEDMLFMNAEHRELIDRYTNLDEKGRQAVRALVALETVRINDAEAYSKLGEKYPEA